MPTEPQCPERESNPQTLGFKPSRSAELAYLGQSSPGRTRTADCHLVRVLPLPLGYRTMFLKWSHRELHPDFQRAMLASSCWTMTPCLFQRKPWGSNPQAAYLPPTAFQAGSSPVRMTSVVFTKAEAVRLELTSGCSPPPAFKAGPSSGRMASVFKLRRLESNQHEDVQSVSSCR